VKTPRYTDTHRFPAGGYRRSVDTDIRETFERARREEQERMRNVRPINPKARKA
jgi:hypothetical protein